MVVAGYSGTPLATKLGIKQGASFALLDAPGDLDLVLPPGVALKRRAVGRADVVAAFFVERGRFEARLVALAKMILPSGGLWIAWPKKSSGVRTDLSDHVIRDAALAMGLVDNKVCAIDDTWSALRLVWRTELRSPIGDHRSGRVR